MANSPNDRLAPMPLPGHFPSNPYVGQKNIHSVSGVECIYTEHGWVAMTTFVEQASQTFKELTINSILSEYTDYESFKELITSVFNNGLKEIMEKRYPSMSSYVKEVSTGSKPEAMLIVVFEDSATGYNCDVKILEKDINKHWEPSPEIKKELYGKT